MSHQHGHSHGGVPCHGHGQPEEEEDTHAHAHAHAHSHSHSHAPPPSHSHGHSHGGVPCHGHGGPEEEEESEYEEEGEYEEEEGEEEEEHGHGHTHGGAPCHGHGAPDAHQHGHAHDPDMFGLDDLQIALLSLERNDAHHAIHHASNVVGDDPISDESENLLEKIFNLKDDKESIVELRGGGYYGKVAIHAWILAKINKLEDAMSLIFQVYGASQDERFLVWVLKWLDKFAEEREAAKKEGKEPTELAFPTLPLVHACIPSIERTTGRLTLWPSESQVLFNAGRVFVRAEELGLLEKEQGIILSIIAGVLRRTRHLETSISIAQRAFRIAPSFSAGTALGLSQRLNGNFNASTMAFLAAQEAEPNDAAIEAELGRLRWDQKQYQQAVQHFEKFGGDDIELNFGLKWLKWKLNPEDPANQAGKEIAERVGLDVEMGPDDTRLLPQAINGVLLPPEDAMCNVMRQVIEQNVALEKGSKLELTVSSLESPSNYIVASLGLNIPFEDIEVAVGSVPRPDPRRPLVPNLPFSLWKYEGTRPVRTVPPPDAKVWDAVLPIASVRYYLPRYWRLAKAAADSLIQAGVRIVEVASCMVHPPPIPESWKKEPWSYVQQVQVACAMIIARWEEDASPFEDSPRSMVLSMLILGPSDWVCAAAMIALSEVALNFPSTCRHIRDFLKMHTQAAPQDSPCAWIKTLLACIARLPGPKQ